MISSLEKLGYSILAFECYLSSLVTSSLLVSSEESCTFMIGPLVVL